MRRATVENGLDRRHIRFQFTPVMRRATSIGIGKGLFVGVSIHARHATGDSTPEEESEASRVSIHARHATGDSCDAILLLRGWVSIHARHATGDK